VTVLLLAAVENGEITIFVQSCGEAVNLCNCFQNVLKIVTQTSRVAAYTGKASDNTLERNFSGSAFGVSTSMGTPSNCINS
jgi:hypothetical protein